MNLDYFTPTTLAAMAADLCESTPCEEVARMFAKVRAALVANVGETEAELLITVAAESVD